MTDPRPLSSPAGAQPCQRVLGYLTAKERDALRLRWAGYSNRQAAAALGITRSAVAMRFQRARRRLAPWPHLRALLSSPRASRHG
jgi:DNA-directed RNA polymerase specialized sigma24 family protein